MVGNCGSGRKSFPTTFCPATAADPRLRGNCPVPDLRCIPFLAEHEVSIDDEPAPDARGDCDVSHVVLFGRFGFETVHAEDRAPAVVNYVDRDAGEFFGDGYLEWDDFEPEVRVVKYLPFNRIDGSGRCDADRLDILVGDF